MTVTDLFTTVAETDIPPEFKRDRWGRPTILMPDGTRKSYTRCSSAAKTIEDTYNLEKWARRNIAYGMAYDPSLVARVIAIGGEPSTWQKPEKDQVNQILEAADAVAKAHKRADMGTAVHHMTHRVDRGEAVNAGPYQADLDAYTAALKDAHLTVDERYIECRMVNDDLEMAGTADRILYTGTDFVIADIKTGATIDFGGLGWAAQLAAYAGGQLYDPDTEQRIHTPPIDRKIGLIIHLPAGEGRCDIYEVDIAQGLAAARLANEIRATRKASKTWIRPVKTAASSPQPVPTGSGVSSLSPDPVDEPRRQELRRRFDLLNDHDQARFRGLLIDPNNLDLIETHLDAIDIFMHNDIPPAPKPEPVAVDVPPTAPKIAPTPEPSLGPDIEGPAVDDATWSTTARQFDGLSTEGKAWIKAIVDEAHHGKTYISGLGNKTTRRHRLLRGLVTLAADGHTDNDLVRLIIGSILDSDDPMNNPVPVGQCLGELAVAGATRFDEMSTEFCEVDRLQASVRPDGTMRLIPVAQAKATP